MLYSLCRRVLFSMQPETAHNVTMANLDWATHLGLHKLLTHMPDEDPVEVMGLRFPNTIGLAAGMDKDGIRVNAFGALGFGHVEIGTITPLAQPGNPKPRCFRVIPAKGIINRMGFNNEGCDKVIENLRSADAFRLRGGILGINIGKNAVTPIENALSDYEKCLDKVYDHADYIAVNISSPNTKNLRQLQGADKFDHLVSGIVTRRQQLKDARNGMATELTEAFSKALPAKKKAFQSRLKAWQKEEKAIEKSMGEFAANHKNATYGATEAVAYYLMSDMGFQDDTPKGFARSAASGGEPAPADLQEFQSLIESQGISVLVNNTQESSDATNMLTGTAGRAGVPVFDVSEQMPQAYTTLTDWIADLVARLDKTVSPAIIDDSDESGSSDGKDGASAKNDAGNSADDKSDTGAGSSN